MNIQRITLIAVTMTALLLAIFVGISIAQGDLFTLAIGGASIIGIAWVVAGQKAWWTSIVFGFLLGGVFQVGFKIHTYELAILLSFAALIPQLALNHSGSLQKRNGFPIIMGILAAYMIVHFGGSLIYNKMMGIGALGNVTRAYSGALWAIGMCILVYTYGLSRAIAFAFNLGYLALFLRLAEGWAVYFLNRPLMIPGINFMGSGSFALLAGDDEGFGFSQDLRHSGLFLATFALAAFGMSRNKPIRWLHLMVFLVGSISIPFGGGRAAILFWAILPLFYFYIYKRYVLLIASLSAILLGLATLNVFPSVLHTAPMPIERALSRFVFTETHDRQSAAASDHFHERLIEEAYLSWTQNLGTFLFGTGIRGVEKGFDVTASYGFGDSGIWVETMVANAKRAGAYESGFWTIVAVTGLVGLFLYVGTLLYLSWKAFADLNKHGVCDPGRAFGFIGLYNAVIWISLSWKVGGAFPSLEIFFLFLSWIWRCDENRRLKLQKNSASPPHSYSAIEGLQKTFPTSRT